MRFNIITNLANGIGLQRDYEILREELEALGHRVYGIQFNGKRALAQMPKVHVNLFLEVVVPAYFPAATEQWVIPNPEWWKPEYTPFIRKFSKVLCKTRDCLEIFRRFVKPHGVQVQYLGFRSRDLLVQSIARERRFLHVAGNSVVKNTDVILEAWRGLPYPLTIVSSLNQWHRRASQLGSTHIEVLPRLPDDELAILANLCQFHLCPSQYEGFGHYLNEGMGVGAVVLTTDTPPMNEFGLPKELLIPVTPLPNLRLAQMRKVRYRDMVMAVNYVWGLSDVVIQHYSMKARASFEQQTEVFRKNLTEILAECPMVTKS